MEFWLKSLKGKYHLGKLGIDEGAISKLMLKKYGVDQIEVDLSCVCGKKNVGFC
jgi:hypothetical protein